MNMDAVVIVLLFALGSTLVLGSTLPLLVM